MSPLSPWTASRGWVSRRGGRSAGGTSAPAMHSLLRPLLPSSPKTPFLPSFFLDGVWCQPAAMHFAFSARELKEQLQIWGVPTDLRARNTRSLLSAHFTAGMKYLTAYKPLEKTSVAFPLLLFCFHACSSLC